MKSANKVTLIIICLCLSAIHVQTVTRKTDAKNTFPRADITNLYLSVYDYNQYNFTCTGTNTDDANFTLYIRSNSTKVSSYNTTIAAGKATWLYNDSLYSLEYQLNVTSTTMTNGIIQKSTILRPLNHPPILV